LRHFFVSRNLIPVLSLVIGSLLASCASYKQNIMFKVPEGAVLKAKVETAEQNYTIQRNDALQLNVYTNDGERLIDPEAVLSQERPIAAEPAPPQYIVGVDGKVKFPMVGDVMIEGLTIRQAEGFLQDAYAKFYKVPFVRLKYVNKRVIVLGAPEGLVVPLVDENVRLTEVLALSKAVIKDSKAHNIRVLRGEEVFVADLSTIEGYLKNNMIIQPGDIVYVEPVRRPFSEGVREYLPLVSMLTSLTTLIVVLTTL
jgi:polysaccharide export outer membrane protein